MILPGAIAILVALDPVLAFAELVPLSVSLTLMVATAWHLERRHRRLRGRRAGIAIAMIERVAIAPELDLMGRTNKELRALDEKGTALRSVAVARRGRRRIAIRASGRSGLRRDCHDLDREPQRNRPATVAASLSVIALVTLPMQDRGTAGPLLQLAGGTGKGEATAFGTDAPTHRRTCIGGCHRHRDRHGGWSAFRLSGETR